MTDEPEKLAAKVIVLSTPSSPNADLVMNLSRPSGIRLWGPVEPAPGLDINSNIRLMDEITEASRRALVRIMGVPLSIIQDTDTPVFQISNPKFESRIRDLTKKCEKIVHEYKLARLRKKYLHRHKGCKPKRGNPYKYHRRTFP
jgi:hypothetical protein